MVPVRANPIVSTSICSGRGDSGGSASISIFFWGPILADQSFVSPWSGLGRCGMVILQSEEKSTTDLMGDGPFTGLNDFIILSVNAEGMLFFYPD